MTEYIKRRDAIRICQHYSEHCFLTSDSRGEDVAMGIEDEIAKIPTAEVEEVKHGEWIYHFDDLFPAESTQECSVCHEEEFMRLCNDNHCPNCGAKMYGKKVD